MCGRYSLKSNPSKIAEEFNLPENETEKLKPRYNIAPSQPVAAFIPHTGPAWSQAFNATL
jgi:putative SOS response-associated peptidase YedK